MKRNYDLDRLKEIYLVSNNASYLFKEFSEDEGIRFVLGRFPTRILVEKFQELIKSPIVSLEDLTYAYALYITIIIKNDQETANFLRSHEAIEFEWFPELRNIYLTKIKPNNSYIISQISTSSLNRIYYKSPQNFTETIEL